MVYFPGGLILDGDGNLYGTTSSGGPYASAPRNYYECNPATCGVVFELPAYRRWYMDRDRALRFLFADQLRRRLGAISALIMDGFGNLYWDDLRWRRLLWCGV